MRWPPQATFSTRQCGNRQYQDVTIHCYNAESLIDKVTFVETSGGGKRAYLHARDGTALPDLAGVKGALNKHGWQYIPFNLNGEPVLEVRGFHDKGDLFARLREDNLIKGQGAVTTTKDDAISFSDRVRKNTLKLSGFFNFIGDIGYFTYGWKRLSANDTAAGLSYFVGSFSLFNFGQGDKSYYQLKDISRKLRRFIAEADPASIPDCAALNAIAKEEPNKTSFQKMHDFFSQYPSEITNAFFGLAGTLIALGAMKELQHPLTPVKKFSRYMDIGVGMFTAGSGAISAIMKEKAPDIDQPKDEGMLAKVMDWVHEKPLRVAGYGYMVSTLLHACSTVNEYSDAIKTRKAGTLVPGSPEFDENRRTISGLPWRALFVGTNLIAEFLLAISSKGHGQGVKSDHSLDDSAYSVAADLIAKKPTHQRAIMIDHMAGFLAHPDVLGGDVQQITDKLKQQIAVMDKNPWAHPSAGENLAPHGKWAARTLASQATSPGLAT